MLKLLNTRPSPLEWAFVVGLFAAFVGNVPAVVDDAHSYAMDAATPFVEQDFKVRSDYWSGKLKSGEKKAVRHQLFRGNEYCFWLGADVEGAKFTLAVYDAKGKLVKVQETLGKSARTVRLLPPSTGNYVIVFTISFETTEEDGDTCAWALAYGYR